MLHFVPLNPSILLTVVFFPSRCQFCRLQKCLAMGMRSDSPRVAAASEARRSSSLTTSGKRVSLEAEAAYDSPTLLPRRSLVFPPHLNHAANDPKLEQPPAQDEDFSSSKSSSGECACTVFPFVTITATTFGTCTVRRVCKWDTC
jgi:hypothetical protein